MLEGGAMPIPAVDHLEAALARLTREDIAALPPSRRQRLKAALGTWECLCDKLAQPKPEPTRFYVTADAKERLQAQQEQTNRVLGDPRNEHRGE
jgi:hypothetical protein